MHYKAENASINAKCKRVLIFLCRFSTGMTGKSVWAYFALSSFCLFVLFESPLVLAGSDELGDSPRSNRERRAPFSSWAGKRSSGEELSSAELDQVNLLLMLFYLLTQFNEALKRTLFRNRT